MAISLDEMFWKSPDIFIDRCLPSKTQIQGGKRPKTGSIWNLRRKILHRSFGYVYFFQHMNSLTRLRRHLLHFWLKKGRIFIVNQIALIFFLEWIFTSDFFKTTSARRDLFISGVFQQAEPTPWYPTHSQVTQGAAYQPQNRFGRIPRKTCLHLSARSLKDLRHCHAKLGGGTVPFPPSWWFSIFLTSDLW